MFNNRRIKHKKNQRIIQINLNKIKIYIIHFKNKILNNLQLIDKWFLMIFLILMQNLIHNKKKEIITLIAVLTEISFSK